MTAEELKLNGISKATDPGSGGRHMSNHHFAKPEWHIENISSLQVRHDTSCSLVWHVQWYIITKRSRFTSHGESASSKALLRSCTMVPALNACPYLLYAG
jgi:2-oxoisovalerate dehydrogenase E1 component